MFNRKHKVCYEEETTSLWSEQKGSMADSSVQTELVE